MSRILDFGAFNAVREAGLATATEPKVCTMLSHKRSRAAATTWFLPQSVASEPVSRNLW